MAGMSMRQLGDLVSRSADTSTQNIDVAISKRVLKCVCMELAKIEDSFELMDTVKNMRTAGLTGLRTEAAKTSAKASAKASVSVESTSKPKRRVVKRSKAKK